MRLRPAHWCFALAFAVAVHSIGLLYFLDFRAAPGGGEPGLGGPITVVLQAAAFPAPPIPMQPLVEEPAPVVPEPIPVEEPVEEWEERSSEEALEVVESLESVQPVVSEAPPAPVVASVVRGGAPTAPPGGSVLGIGSKYEQALWKRLARYKRYPRAAQLQQRQGRVIVFIRMSRGGEILESRLEQSSGSDVLDQAALRAVAKANPLPEPPPDFPESMLAFQMPFEFQLH